MSDYVLIHHGIKGQRWGDRNGPPYPLSSSAKSSTEKKAGSELSAISNKRIGSIDPETLSSAITAVAALSFVAVKEIQAYRATKKFNDAKRERERKFDKNVKSEDDLPKKKEMGTWKDDMAATNPHLPKSDEEYQNNNGYVANCMYCTTIYDLRRRGYDVTANAREMGGLSEEVTEWYKGAKMKSFNKKDKMLKELISQGKGARGNLLGEGLYSGHSIAYEVGDGGKVKFIDAQINKEWSYQEFTKMFSKHYDVIRTDNCEPNWEKIGECIDPECLNKKG